MRAVSLLPSATEIVAAIGARDTLVGASHACDFPADLSPLPRLTSCDVHAAAPPGAIDAEVRALVGAGAPLYTLDERAIAALAPDVIFTQALCDVCAVVESDVRALAARLAAPPRVVTLGATSLDGVFADIVAVAEALDCAGAGTALVDALRARVRLVHETLKAARAPRPKAVVIEWTDPVYLGGHWVPELVARAGGIDLLGVAGAHSPRVSIDAVATVRPEIVLVAPCGYDLSRAAAEARQLMDDPAWHWLRNGDVWALDANALTSRPGPRLVDGIETIARIFAPSLFPPPDARLAERVYAANAANAPTRS